MDATSWATFWAFVSLIIFLGIAVWFKAPGMIAKALDDRSDKIRKDLGYSMIPLQLELRSSRKDPATARKEREAKRTEQNKAQRKS